MPMMGRGSDTRMYSPRSESATMYSSVNEDETRYGPTSSYDKEKRMDEKKAKEESRKKKLKDIKHIKIKPSQGLSSGPELETEGGLDDGNKRDDEREIGLQGGPAGSRGHLLDLATGAKTGTGSAMGSIMTGKPMKDAWSELLKGTELEDFMQQYPDIKFQTQEVWDSPLTDVPLDYGLSTHGSQSHLNTIGDNARSRTMNPQRMDILQRFLDRSKAKPKIIQQVHGHVENPYFVPPGMKSPPLETEDSNPRFENEEFYDALDFEYPKTQEMIDEHYRRYDIQTGEPMEDAWSTLLKRETPKTIEARRRREKRQEFRPSTGQFKRPPGGMDPRGATMRRFKARMRGIKGGRKTGLMKPHLSVEMSHRGIATKQPMSKDPQKYRQYMGQSEARKILGNVRTTFSPHARHSARSFYAGPTGAGRLGGLMPGQQGMMLRPSLRRMSRPRLPRVPRVPRPPMPPMPQIAPPMSSVPSMPAQPSSIMMSDEREESEMMKGNRHASRTEYLKLLRELMKLQRERLNKAINSGSLSATEEGAVPAHPAGVHQHEDEDEKNDGPTQNLETNSSRLGLDPAGYLVSRRGHMG